MTLLTDGIIKFRKVIQIVLKYEIVWVLVCSLKRISPFLKEGVTELNFYMKEKILSSKKRLNKLNKGYEIINYS